MDVLLLEKRGNKYQKHMFFKKRNIAVCPFLKTSQYQKIAKENELPLSCPISAVNLKYFSNSR